MSRRAPVEPRFALTVGGVTGGQHDREAVRAALRSAVLATEAASPEVIDPSREACVNVIFQVSGHLYSAEHQGPRTGRFTKSKGLLVIEVGVPDDLSDPHEVNRFYADSLVRAVELAEEYLSRTSPTLSVDSAKKAAIAARKFMVSGLGDIAQSDRRVH